MRHLLSIADLSTTEIEAIFSISDDLKVKFRQGVREPLLPGRTLALLFEKPSLRTRVSFETAIVHLGGASIFLDANSGFGKREPIADFGRVLSEYVDAVAVRSFAHATLEALAENCTCCVINALTDQSHPCQALADLFTLKEEFGKLDGLKLAYVGDANNVASSLALACCKLGVEFSIASPEGYQFSEKFFERHREQCKGLQISSTKDPAEAVADADAVYTDVWASMGQEAEAKQRAQAFRPFQVDAALMQQAKPEAVFLHCLPAHRGEEVTDEVIESAQSRVFQQAGNRMHVQKGLLAWLLSRDS